MIRQQPHGVVRRAQCVGRPPTSSDRSGRCGQGRSAGPAAAPCESTAPRDRHPDGATSPTPVRQNRTDRGAHTPRPLADSARSLSVQPFARVRRLPHREMPAPRQSALHTVKNPSARHAARRSTPCVGTPPARRRWTLPEMSGARSCWPGAPRHLRTVDPARQRPPGDEPRQIAAREVQLPGLSQPFVGGERRRAVRNRFGLRLLKGRHESTGDHVFERQEV
jgi:hypothetical protein